MFALNFALLFYAFRFALYAITIMFKKNNSKRSTSGRLRYAAAAQSYTETIIAVGLITTALVALLGLGVSQTRLGQQTSQKIVAYNLAEEGIEVVKSIHYNRRLSGSTWPQGISNGKWIVDYDSAALVTSTDDSLANCATCYLCTQSDSSFRSCSDSFAKLKRLVVIEDGSADNNKKITSQILYAESGGWRSYNLEEYLYNSSQ